MCLKLARSPRSTVKEEIVLARNSGETQLGSKRVRTMKIKVLGKPKGIGKALSASLEGAIGRIKEVSFAQGSWRIYIYMRSEKGLQFPVQYQSEHKSE
ncbi:hypothetical protein NPIL_158281 [Nephila pilipes]|uniref:Uncharacterized protein n=1 Tax=Nephila pilipes TaxID=299642 RepID=A0A8X6P616_NEPPI|nr:hypothetical protein NPIL_158281 [Nephila pilipes]